jgi:broad specificity phosphatase PhoE
MMHRNLDRRVEALVHIRRLVSSPSVRCADTLAPYAAAARLRVRAKEGLSEEGFATRPEAASRQVARLLERGEPPPPSAPTGRYCPGSSPPWRRGSLLT